jgi:tetratricopeptide (TPR) repeat protein
MPDARACGDEALLERDVAPPADPAVAARVSAAEDELARIRAAIGAGRYDDAVAAADALARDTDAIGYEPIAAEVADTRASLANLRGDPDAVARLEASHLRLRRAGLSIRAAEVALAIAIVHANRGRLDEAERWWLLGDADVSGLGLPALQQMLSARAHAAVLDKSGRSEEARAEAERALDLAIGYHGEVAVPDVISALDSLATVADSSGRYDDAIAYDRRAIALAEARHGTDHPSLVHLYSNHGSSLAAAGHDEEALAAHRGGLAIARATLAAGSAELAIVIQNLGVAEIGVAPEDAVAHLEEAVAMLTAVGEPARADSIRAGIDLGLAEKYAGRLDDARATLERWLIAARDAGDDLTGQALHALAAVEIQSERYAAARVLLEEALAIQVRLGASPAALGVAHADLASVLLGLGDLRAAIAACEEALRLFEGTGIDEDYVASAELRMAVGLWELGERARSREVIDRAAARTLGPYARKAVDAWRESHP